MRKLLIPVLLLLGFAQAFADECCCKQSCCPTECDPCDCQVSSHTFFTPQTQFRLGSPERITAFRDRSSAREEGHGGALQIVPFGGRSTAPEKLATYFGPNCKTEWTVKEQEADAEVSAPPVADIRGHLFNIVTTNGDFESKIRFCPRQSVFGIGLTWKQEFARDEDTGKCFWLAVSTPLVHVKNSMGFYEKVINDGGGAVSEKTVGSMAAAFSQASWNCGKIASCAACCKTNCTNGCNKTACCPTSSTNCSTSCNTGGCCPISDNCASVTNCYNMTRTRLADIDIQLGWDWLREEKCHLDGYWGLLIPTGNCASSGMLFEPVVGNGKHFGISHGNTLAMEIWRSEEQDDRYLQFIFDIHGYYLFARKECRLVDLKGKPWSRYMPVFKDKAQAEEAATNEDKYLYTPGVNVFCRELCVKPGCQCSTNSAFVFTSGNFRGEGGLNCFCRQAECIDCSCAWKEGPALKDVYWQHTEEAGSGTEWDDLTNRAQLLNENFANEYIVIENYEYAIIKDSDIDYQSAAHPAMLSSTFYGSLSYRWDDKDIPPFVALGGSYEFGRGNAVMNRWMMWAKAGFSY